MTEIYAGPELSRKERITILSKRLANMQVGAGEYTAAGRAAEIAETRDALADAWAETGHQPKAVAHG